MRILVTEAEQRNSLAVIRSLGSVGHTVYASSRFRTAQGLFSRCCHTKIHHSDLQDSPNQYAKFLISKAIRFQLDAILPGHEFSVVAFSRYLLKNKSPIPILCSSDQAVQRSRDKWSVIQLAENLGIPTPRTFLVKTGGDFESAAESLRFPFILKPRSGTGAAGFKIVRNLAELRSFFRQATHRTDLVYNYQEWLLQELITGPVHDVNALVVQGEPCVLLTQKRLRMYPSCGGRCVLGETTDNSVIREYARQILQELGLHGPAQVEFKYDPVRGDFRVLDVNPRFWGSTELSIHAGVDFPQLAATLAVDGYVDPPTSYRIGARMHWFWPYEIFSLFQEKPRLRNLLEFLVKGRRGRYDLLFRDPLPHIAHQFYLLSTQLGMKKP